MAIVMMQPGIVTDYLQVIVFWVEIICKGSIKIVKSANVHMHAYPQDYALYIFSIEGKDIPQGGIQCHIIAEQLVEKVFIINIKQIEK